MENFFDKLAFKGETFSRLGCAMVHPFVFQNIFRNTPPTEEGEKSFGKSQVRERVPFLLIKKETHVRGCRSIGQPPAKAGRRRQD